MGEGGGWCTSQVGAGHGQELGWSVHSTGAKFANRRREGSGREESLWLSSMPSHFSGD